MAAAYTGGEPRYNPNRLVNFLQVMKITGINTENWGYPTTVKTADTVF